MEELDEANTIRQRGECLRSGKVYEYLIVFRTPRRDSAFRQTFKVFVSDRDAYGRIPGDLQMRRHGRADRAALRTHVC